LRFGQALFEAAPSSRKKLLISEELTHNDPWPPEYYDQLKAFMDQLPDSRESAGSE
jgi:fermentation-respiration switch protein FrsA (DUF1100 family)